MGVLDHVAEGADSAVVEDPMRHAVDDGSKSNQHNQSYNKHTYSMMW